ncbi:MAG: ATP-binding protein [Treponema sp.]|nr:ATP-binding protein [Treponema sp.]
MQKDHVNITVSIIVLAIIIFLSSAVFFAGAAFFLFLSPPEPEASLPLPALFAIFAVKLVALNVFLVIRVLRKIKNTFAKEHEEFERIEIFLETAPFVMNIWDDERTIASTSKQVMQMFDLESEEQYLKRFFELSPEFQPCGLPSSEKAFRFVKEAFQSDQRVQFEWMHQTLQAEPVPSEVTLQRYFFQGKYFVAAYTVDLRKIKAAEDLTRKLLDNSPMFIEFWDEYGNLLDCNEKFLKLFQLGSKDDFVKQYNKYVPQLQPCGTPSEIKNKSMVKKAIEGGSSRSEWIYILPDGEQMPQEATWVRIMHQGKPMIIVYSQDLRPVKLESKRAHAEIQRRETAEGENKAKTRFLARMSHEIRTPMNAVLGIAEIQLRKGGHPQETEEAFLRIHNSAHLLLSIINDILDLSKVEAGKMEIVPAIYDVVSLIYDTIHLNAIYIGSKEIEFSLHVDEKLPLHLLGDELRIKQILNNLLSNAFKYTEKGSVSLSFDAEFASNNGNFTLIFTVTDSGQGMSEEEISLLFDEFSRFRLRSNRGTEGSGLGMPITHSLVSLMGGTITVKSTPGSGSIFTVRLPQKLCNSGVLGKEVAEKLQDLKTTQASPNRVTKFEQKLMPYGTVLAVDDVSANLYVIEGILSTYEIQVDVVTSGSAAIEKIKSGKIYDVIFMDHMMPGMDGIETVKHIREMGYTHPIVALTANALKDAPQMFLNNGFSGFISKPIDITQIDLYLMRFVYNKHNKIH